MKLFSIQHKTDLFVSFCPNFKQIKQFELYKLEIINIWTLWDFYKLNSDQFLMHKSPYIQPSFVYPCITKFVHT